MTNWVIGNTDRFAAAVSQRSISNWISKCMTTDIGYYFNMDQIHADPWNTPDKMWFHSPLKYANKAKTPTLFIQSDEDYRCWMGDALQMFSALRYFGVETRLCLFHGENHESVYTTNPELRVKMMGNRFAGQVLEILPRLANAGIQLNCQLVLCPGINDGAELERSLTDLGKLAPALQSIALVPVGVTKYREGLYPLRPYTKEEAGQTIDIIDRFGNQFEQEYGSRIAYASDEFYLTAERPIPNPEFYGDFSQIESGVGAMACLKDEFLYALEERLDGQETIEIPKRHITLATGVAAYPFLNELLDEVRIKCNNLTCNVVPIINHFFGETITVAGLMTGTDILSQLKEKTLGDELLLPEVILRHNTNILLDDITLDDISNQLQIPIKTVMNDGQHLLHAVLGE